MKRPGRKRKHNPSIPAHIDQERLPRGVYWDPTGNGRWYVMSPKRETIAQRGARLSELHELMEKRDGIDRHALNWMLSRFHEHAEFRGLAERTQKDYERYRRIVAELPTKVGKPLGALEVAKLSLPFMQRILDVVADDHPTKANHLHRYLRRAFSWGMRRGYCTENPAKGVRQAKERKNPKTASREVLRAIRAFARERGSILAHTKGSVSPYLWILIEIGYRCRLRPVEVITLTDANATDVGIVSNRRKGSLDNTTRWSIDLREAWDAGVALRAKTWARLSSAVPIKPQDRPLIVSQNGEALKRSSLDSAWIRLMDAAVEAGVITDEQRFGMHALKHRGVTDTKGTRKDKQQASGHKNEAMLDVYDHELPTVDPADFTEHFTERKK